MSCRRAVFASLFLLVLSTFVATTLETGECFDDIADRSKCNCTSSLQPGQFYCLSPEIDEATQSERGCRADGMVRVPCFAAPNVTCCDQPYNESQCLFRQDRNCRRVTGQQYDYYVAVTLSLFLGFLGIDRFYLGYPAIGLMKLCTMGFLFIGHLIDFLLILTQVVGPSDRTGYYAPFYGPLLTRVNTTDIFLPASAGVTP